MREILFRGKDYLGNWHIGSLVKKTCENNANTNYYANSGMCNHIISVGDYYIIDENGEGFWVSHNTVGQYTELTDYNGLKVFQGDIVRLHYFFENHDPSNLGAFEDENEIIAEICKFEMGWGFTSKYQNDYLCNYVQEPSEELEVIGNIYDNPELLEEEQ